MMAESISLTGLGTYRGRIDSLAQPDWPETGVQYAYEFASGDVWADRDGWDFAGGTRIVEVDATMTPERGARYQYAGGNDPFGDGAATPEQYFSLTDAEYSEFWFKRRIFIPENYVHREMLRLTLDDVTGWEIGDQIHGTAPQYTAEIQYVDIASNRISVTNAVDASINSRWVGSVTNITKTITATCSNRFLAGANNKFQVFFCDGYSSNGDSPTFTIQLWPSRFSPAVWGKGSEISVQCGVNSTVDGSRIVTQSPRTSIIEAPDLGKWMDLVFYCKMSSAPTVLDGVFVVWKRSEGEENYTKIHDYRLLDAGERPGSGKFRNGYIWGWANSGYEAPTKFIESRYIFSTSAIDGCIP